MEGEREREGEGDLVPGEDRRPGLRFLVIAGHYEVQAAALEILFNHSHKPLQVFLTEHVKTLHTHYQIKGALCVCVCVFVYST